MFICLRVNEYYEYKYNNKMGGNCTTGNNGKNNRLEKEGCNNFNYIRHTQ